MNDAERDELLIRIDERVEDAKEDRAQIKESISGMEKVMKEGYVRKEEFEPIKKVVYGLVALILGGVGTGFMALILQNSGGKP